jgi:capsule polysaccharide export protein KpsE/RkpR
MATILSTARSLSAQDAPKIDGISARDDFLRKEAERGSRELLAAMIRELQSMGVVA